jgi:hypothetical protein
VTWDVMILARAAINANTPLANWPFAMTQHTAPATGVPSDDYSGADAARALAGSYAALYTNVDLGFPAANAITHNFGTATDCVALIAHSATAPGTSVPTISNNATSTTTLSLTCVTGAVADCYVLLLRPYSMFQPTCTTA